MEERVALIGIVVENYESVAKLNDILHQYGDIIIGRMGIPYKKRGVSVMSVAVDADEDTISAMSGKIGKLPGISSKTVYAKMGSEGSI